MAGVWVQISLFFLSFVFLLVAITWSLTGPVLRGLGYQDVVVRPAVYYALVLITALPARIIIRQTSQLLAAQRITYPLVVCGLFALFFNLIVGLVLVLGYPIPGWSGLGFTVCPIISAGVEWY
jgi:Na+-driven multidrug efflux pump